MRITSKVLMITLMTTVLVAVGASGVFALAPQHGQVTIGPWNSAQYGVIVFSGNNPMDIGVNVWNSSYVTNMVPENFSFASYVGNAPSMMYTYDNYNNVTLSSPTFSNVTTSATGYIISEPYSMIINAPSTQTYI
jgi:hypothetical protein